MIDAELKHELLLAFEYSYAHDDWVEPLDTLLAGLSAEESSFGPKAPSIWAIVLHLAVWNENIVERIQSGQNVRPAEGAWPPLPLVIGETEWNEAKNRLKTSLDLVRTTIETTPIEKIQASPYGLADLLCRFTHLGYHLGQIVKLREGLATSSS